jgi:hypothetical protein
MALVGEALASPDVAVCTAAMNALRAFRWTEPTAPLFLGALEGLEQRPHEFLTAVLINTAEIVSSPSSSGALGQGIDWQMFVMTVAGHAVAESAPFLRVLVPRAKRDGDPAELYRVTIPLFVAYFRLAAVMVKIEGVELGPVMETAFMTIAAAFDLPEIIEAIIAVFIALTPQNGVRMAADPSSIWMPLSIILTPGFSPVDSQWIPAIVALIQYHRALANAQTAAFWATFEAAVAQFMDPAEVVPAYREILIRTFAEPPYVLTQELAQVYVQLHARAVTYSWGD